MKRLRPLIKVMYILKDIYLFIQIISVTKVVDRQNISQY